MDWLVDLFGSLIGQFPGFTLGLFVGYVIWDRAQENTLRARLGPGRGRAHSSLGGSTS